MRCLDNTNETVNWKKNNQGTVGPAWVVVLGGAAFALELVLGGLAFALELVWGGLGFALDLGLGGVTFAFAANAVLGPLPVEGVPATDEGVVGLVPMADDGVI